MKKIFPVLWGMMLAMSLFITFPVYAKSENVQTITLTSIDDWYENALAGTQVTLAEKIEGSYVEIEGITNVTIPAAGMELELKDGEYRLTVVKTPNGYETSEQPIEFQVTGSEVTILQAENAEITETEDGFAFTLFCAQEYKNYQLTLPSTGGTGSMRYFLSGLLLAAAAVFGGIFLFKKSSGKLLSFLFFAGTFAVLAGSVSTISVQAAGSGSSQRGYHWYAMMKTLDSDVNAEYYVEDENLAKALKKMTVRGKAVFTVESADNGIWYVTTSEETDCTEKEVAKALASIKDYAIESGITTDLAVELEDGAVILVQTRAGTYFLVEVEAGKQYLVERPAAASDKNTVPKIESLSVPTNGKNSAEIGGTVEYELKISFGRETQVKLCMEVPEGLTCNEPTAGTGLTLKKDNANSTLTKQVYTVSYQSTTTSSESAAYTITGTVTINENAAVGTMQNLKTYIKYGTDFSSQSETFELSFYTYGFNLQRLNSVNRPLSGVSYTLSKKVDETDYYYTLPTNANDVKEARFQTVSEGGSIPTVTTDNEGKISFAGLAEGTYTLTEIEQSGENASVASMTIVVDNEGRITLESPQTGVQVSQRGENELCDTLIVTNQADITMPMTGSNSRIAFQMVGSLLTLLTGALLISFRKEIFHVK